VHRKNHSLSMYREPAKKKPPTSSRNGVNLGVLGTTTPAADSGAWSTNGVKPRGPASPTVLVGTGGGGILISPAGGTGGSRNGTIFEPDPEVVTPDPEPELDAILLERPACFSVVPTNFFTSGAFSLIRVLRVPRSSHAFVVLLWLASAASEPEGSTNIRMRLLVDEVGFLDVPERPPRDEGVRADEDDTDEDAGKEYAVVARACLGT
jgi:hypothetical protein